MVNAQFLGLAHILIKQVDIYLTLVIHYIIWS